MLLDANLLLYAVNEESPQHEPARDWLERTLSGSARVGLPWPTLGAFLRIASNPRAVPRPLAASEAVAIVRAWLEVPVVWIPTPGVRHAVILLELLTRHTVTANLVPDAMLAALALEHGLAVVSADSDFARLTPVRWENPLVG